MTTEITEYNPTQLALAELRGKYAAVVFDVSTGKGMTEAKAARAELRDYRIALEKRRVEIKSPALERCRLIDTEAKRITAELSALEDPIDETIKAHESRKAVEKAEREQHEREIVEARNRRFDELRGLPLKAVNATAAEIEALIVEAEANDLADIETEYRDAARHAIGLSVLGLKAALDKRRAEDAQAEQTRKDLEELGRLRAEQEAVRQEADRLARIERERIAEIARKAEEAARAEREAAERTAREVREAEQARLDAERAERRRTDEAEIARQTEELRRQRMEANIERERIADEHAAAKKVERAKAIAEATLLSAATDAVELLKANGLAEHIVTQKLEAAVRREPAKTTRKAA